MQTSQLLNRLKVVACCAVLGATLTACGSSGGGSSAPPQPSAVSQFINMVMSVIDNNTSETGEPEPIGNVVPATSETDEPIAVTL